MTMKESLRRGFTLMELMVVIVIISILAASFSYSMSSAQTTARVAKATAEAREIGNAIRLFALTQENQQEGFEMMGLNSVNGVAEISSTLSTLLTEPSSQNNNVTYFNVTGRGLLHNRLCDPWGNPYMIRVKRITPDGAKNADAYETILPLEGRHRGLQKMTITN